MLMGGASISVRPDRVGAIMCSVTKRWLVALGCCFVVVAVAALLVLRQGKADPVGRTSTAPIVISAGETFSPRDLPTEHAYLTADGAWAKWESGQSLTADVKAQFGVLDYSQGRRLVWAYSERGCAVPFGDPSARDVALAKSPKCRLWTFLDPKTGAQIETTDQLPSSP